MHVYRAVASAYADATALQQQKDLGESYMQLLASHKATAQECIDEYKRHRQQCQSEWQRIQELMAVEKPSQSDIQELVGLKDSFACLLMQITNRESWFHTGATRLNLQHHTTSKNSALTISGSFFMAGRPISSMSITRELLD